MGTYLRVMGVLGVTANLAFLAGDMGYPAQPGTAAARSHRPAPQVQIMISADSKRHQAQDLLSLVLHEKAVERVRANPELIEEAKETVNRWMKSGNTHSHTLYAEWLKILKAKKWSKVLGRSRHAQELRQASPLPTLLSKEDRESILSHVSTLKKGIVFGAEGPLP